VCLPKLEVAGSTPVRRLSPLSPGVSSVATGYCTGVDLALSVDRGPSIALTDRQVAQVLREASHRARLASLLTQVDQLDELSSVALSLLDDSNLSRSTLRALLVLDALPADGGERELTDIARQLDVSASTTHRYIHTWMALGLVEQDPRSRRYRRTQGRARPGNGGAPLA
jgi:DNA-binding MarR family transcriptional regulator